MNQEEKYWLIEYVQDIEGGKNAQIERVCDTLKEALDRFNMDLEGNYLGHPDLGVNPEGYIIKGRKIEIEVKKIGSVKEK